MKSKRVGGRGRGGRGRGGRPVIRTISSGAIADIDSMLKGVTTPPPQEKKDEEDAFSTELAIVFLNGDIKTVHLANGPLSYWELQEQISKYLPGSTQMFSILSDKKKQYITSENFQPSPKFYIKEYFSPIATSRYPLVPVKWDFKTYHAKPNYFYDAEEAKQEDLKKRELMRQMEREQEEQLAREFLASADGS